MIVMEGEMQSLTWLATADMAMNCLEVQIQALPNSSA
jgi:hypothetical protein